MGPTLQLTEREGVTFTNILLGDGLPRRFMVCITDEEGEVGIARMVAVEQIRVELDMCFWPGLNGRVRLVTGKIGMRGERRDQLAFAKVLQGNQMRVVRAVVEDHLDQRRVCGFVEAGGEHSVAGSEMGLVSGGGARCGRRHHLV